MEIAKKQTLTINTTHSLRVCQYQPIENVEHWCIFNALFVRSLHWENRKSTVRSKIEHSLVENTKISAQCLCIATRVNNECSENVNCRTNELHMPMANKSRWLRKEGVRYGERQKLSGYWFTTLSYIFKSFIRSFILYTLQIRDTISEQALERNSESSNTQLNEHKKNHRDTKWFEERISVSDRTLYWTYLANATQ